MKMIILDPHWEMTLEVSESACRIPDLSLTSCVFFVGGRGL